jgi:squamous cell carcinoma antigen recognized by T-cells 3
MRILKNWSGKSKGYGYVDFETSEQATNALKLDRSPIDGRPMFVSRNQDKSTDVPQNKLKYAASLEKNKLFVSGLPFTTESKDLEEIYKNVSTMIYLNLI